MHAEILAIGDEITSGQTLDTNSQWLSQRLEELGVAVHYHSTVGDQLPACAEVFRRAIERADVVVATGGLGPTADDLTREALAEATGRPLALDPMALEQIRRMFASRRRPMPPQNQRQATFPLGSRIVQNPHGTAPGIDLEVPREGRPACRVFCLPGVPAEMIEMWHGSVAPAIADMLGDDRQVIVRRRIHCFGAGESQIESMLPDMIRRGRTPEVGITASKATITLRVAAVGRTPEECEMAMGPTLATIRECLGTLVFGEEGDELQDAVAHLLHERGKTLATAECGTRGLLAEWMAAADGSADVFRGGLVLPQSAEPAEALATRCRAEFAADFGLSVEAFPAKGTVPLSLVRKSGQSPAEGPPQVAVALASAEGIRQRRVSLGIHPDLLRMFVAKHALNFLRLTLLGAAVG